MPVTQAKERARIIANARRIRDEIEQGFIIRELNPLKIGVSVDCAVCGQRKKPLGRSAPLGMEMCDDDCKGYEQKPFPGSLWPGESEADFGYPVGDSGTTLVPEEV
jgi:hypothetical protein